MAIVLKDGFEFLTDRDGLPEAFIIKGENLDQEINYIKEKNIKSIYLTYFKSKNISNLNFLEKINHIEKINFNDIEVDYYGVYNLINLKTAILSVKNRAQYLDYSRFKDLEYLSIDWFPDFPDLTLNKNLKELIIWKFKPKDKSFYSLNLPNSLKSIEVTETNIINLNGLHNNMLEKFELHYSNSLNTLDGIQNISKQLKTLILGNCKKPGNYDNIESCKNLEKIIISNCGDLTSIKWLNSLKKVCHFSFWGTKLIDGDTSPCFGIDYVSFKNAKHYNHKIEEFRTK